ncbi:AT hook domain-containing protein [Apiospora arundinis]|uniref:AT hook domain-containing protein n=1 Tax=Apiospora arundinis TaxID=335852 RepID=A0ABR2IHJ7_9PEZI
MPTALHPQARFDPIPPDLDLHAIVDRNPNFDWVVRVNLAQIRRLGSSGFEKLVQLHVIEGGRPLVIEGWNKVLPDSLFSAKWLEKTHDKKQENVRDIGSQSDIPMTTGHYLRSMRQLTNQWSSTNFRDERRQRLYMKDIDCPQEWHDHLRKVIPPNVFYMNENVSDTVGADTRDDDIFGAPEVSPAVAGDLMSSLPEEMRAQNLMCYIGHEGTYTPAHREMCASLGQNIMVDASGSENGEKPGSSIWFMTETKDREVVREYFLSMLGHDIEIEKHFAQINAWKKANFPVYIVEQKVGDFILVPPLAPHQVWNRGTRTIKVAWNRTTVETLDLALQEALPKARLVCRDEQYKNKAIIYFTLEKYDRELQALEDSSGVGVLGLGRELTQNSPRLRQMASDFRHLFSLFTNILVDEMFGPKHIDVEYIEFDSNITCSYCRSNIFNRFLTCKCCVRQLINGDEDTYDICMECYAMGRSCVCISGLQWCEQWKWSDLVEKHERWRSIVIKQDGFVDIEHSPQPLEIVRRKSTKKSVAQVCQEQLRRRPWSDITKPAQEPAPEPESEAEPEVDEEGRVKKKKKNTRKLKRGDVYRCHVCCHKDYTYKLNFCTTCQEAYCYGVLWRAFDTMPQTAMEKENWQCPKCRGICNCGSCRRAGHTHPYVPKNTLLGHDTRRIADDRSIESIVDFRIHNLNWLKAFGEESRSKDTKRMQRLREQADAEKAKGPLAALDNDDDAPHEVDSSLQGPNMGNAHGDGVDGAPASQNDISDHPDAVAGSRVPTADMSAMDLESSAYPDPSGYNDPVVGARMMGMGFYDQDDSADKILFDPFQMPSEDTLNRETEVSDFVKKTLRLAKRKARLETDDDPDFMGPKKAYPKKPRTGNIDQLMNLDPALLGALGEPDRSGLGTPNRARMESVQAPALPEASSTQQEKPRPKPTRVPLPIDPLRPTLRHAKPVQSYADHEEPEDDPDDIVIPKRLSSFGADNGDTAERDPVDAAAQAFRAVANLSQGANSTAATPYTGKRRGRPPRSSLPAGSPQPAKKQPTIEADKEPPKRRGRPPRRSHLSNVGYAEESPPAQESVNDDSITEEALEAALEAELARESDVADKPSGLEEESIPSVRPAGRRGRPPKSATKPTASPAPEAPPVATPSTQPRFMSMAERMAAKGKKFKMRGSSRTATSSRTNTPSTPQSAAARAMSDQDTPMPDADAVASRSSSIPPKPLGRPGGPTVVRLASMDGSESEETDSSFSDDDDEDIPAKKFVAYRGGMRGRGRGGRFPTEPRRSLR